MRAAVHEFVDAGLSGADENRPAFQRLLDIVSGGSPFDVIVVNHSMEGRSSWIARSAQQPNLEAIAHRVPDAVSKSPFHTRWGVQHRTAIAA